MKNRKQICWRDLNSFPFDHQLQKHEEKWNDILTPRFNNIYWWKHYYWFVSPNQYAQILTNMMIAIAYITILLFFKNLRLLDMKHDQPYIYTEVEK